MMARIEYGAASGGLFDGRRRRKPGTRASCISFYFVLAILGLNKRR